MRLLPIVKKASGSNYSSCSREFDTVAYAMTDDRHFEYLNQFIWVFTGAGYPVRHVGKKAFFLHSEVARKAELSFLECVDHIDRNKLNVQESNLRPATYSEDEVNKGLRSDSTSGFKGVSWHKSRKKWRARISSKKKEIHLGYFDTAEEAALAYDSTAMRFYGSKARTNKALGLF
jgi:hypothetical protein